MKEHHEFMTSAIERARHGSERGEQPFGAVVVVEGSIIGRAYSQKMSETDITAHAEILALRSATQFVGHRDLSDCILYTTCEPCPMCAGAALNANIQGLVFGAHISDLPASTGKAITFSEYTVEAFAQLTGWEVDITSGVLNRDCTALYQGATAPITR